MTKIDIKSIAKKRQEKREESQVYKTKDEGDKPSYYALDMFPYPSGAGLHVGHPKGYLATDVVSRKKQLEGYNVLHPMGFDAFGLGTEQYALTHKLKPADAAAKNIDNFKRQLKSMGFNYDRSREVVTSDPSFYKRTQWMFVQMYEHYYDVDKQSAQTIVELEKKLRRRITKDLVPVEDMSQEQARFLEYCLRIYQDDDRYADQRDSIAAHDEKNRGRRYKKRYPFFHKRHYDAIIDDYIQSRRLAYRDEAPVIRSPTLKTVLAQEDLDEDGNDERTGNPVEIKNMTQWKIRITDYADRLLEGLEDLQEWPDKVKNMQKHRIGKSEGTTMTMSIAFDSQDTSSFVKIQTRLGKEYLIDEVAHHFYQQHNEVTDDGFVELAGAIIQNDKGEYLMMHNKKYERYMAPGGKVKNDETHRHALQTKMKEKLGVDVIVGDFIGSIKQIQGGKKSKLNLYKASFSDDQELHLADIDNISDFAWVGVEESSNDLGFSVRIDDVVIDDAQAIHKTFVTLFMLKGVMSRDDINVNLISNAVFHLPSVLNPDKEYIQYYCTQRDEYFVVPDGKLPPEPSSQSIDVYTTRLDTVYGMSYVALAPEHPILEDIVTKDQKDQVDEYIQAATAKTHLQRTQDVKDKSGVWTGSYVINPFTQQRVPVWVSDYVLMEYGTGAVMAVPAHDERDRDFAQKHDLPIVPVVAPYFPIQEGKDAIRQDSPTVYRHNVHVLVKHWEKDQYLCLDWQEYDWKTMIIGGIESGESPAEAALREVQEETGYTDAVVLQEWNTIAHSHFYASHKKENRYSYDHLVVLQLQSEKQQAVSEDVQGLHSTFWSDALGSVLNTPNELFMWSVYMEQQDIFTQKGIVTKSGRFSGMDSEEAIHSMQEWLVATKRGKPTTTYRLQDWVFSRQRYRGEPFPFVYDENDKEVPLSLKDLPLELPDVDHYESTDTQEGPLAGIDDRIQIEDSDGNTLRRDSNTMPGWAGSSWYWLRYIDPHNDSYPLDPKKSSYRGQVDLYVGGMEHATRHLIYARFWHKFLYDIGVVNHQEPFKKLLTVGLVMAEDGRKMSKRWKNVVDPQEVIETFGSDSFRTYEMFMGPFENEIAWSTDGVKGVKKFLDKFAALLDVIDEQHTADDEELSLLHQTIKKVSEDIDAFKFNTAVSQLMVAVNYWRNKGVIHPSHLVDLVLLLAPFAPHLAEEMWSRLGSDYTTSDSLLFDPDRDAVWPAYKEKHIQESQKDIAIQVNGKVRDTVRVAVDASKDEVLALAHESEKIQSHLPQEIRKVIYVPGKILNIVG